ncbi:MAG: helix-turn-helix transcriptional regulator [Bacteroides sp.]|nr:helix-turn-helix transcriptional regulator [Bacteroides sp.]
MKYKINENNIENFFCCTAISDKVCEGVIDEHMLGFVVSGELTLQSKEKKVNIRNGEAVFIRRNHLVTKLKKPSKNGEPFKGLFLRINVPFLKSISKQIVLPATPLSNSVSQSLHFYVPQHPFLTGLFQSLDAYFTTGQLPSPMIIEAKLKEAVLVLLELKPELAGVLFDFEEPWKTDLRGFMDKNYSCDLTIEQLAHYTGRSLSAFKRDFADSFEGETPARWIVKRRLDESMRLLKKGIPASSVYLKVGFKNLSHFSTAFKRQFGILPTQVETK